ncbi:MAG: YceI family protein [Actinomycetota bacterium]
MSNRVIETDELATASPEAPARSRRPRWRWFALGLVLVVTLAVGVGLWLFFRDDAPDEVSLTSAIENLDAGEETVDTAAGTATTVEAEAVAATDGSITGEWLVDTDAGDFDYESATGSFAGFRIEEELRSIGSTTAVGRTGEITGSITIDGTVMTAASFEIDLTTITTETSNRDDNVQDALETDEFPTAVFTMTEPVELGDAAADGEPVSVVAAGEMTIHGVTNPVDFAVDAQLVDDLVVAVGTTEIVFSDYGVEVPQGGPVISVDDFGVVEWQVLLRR